MKKEKEERERLKINNSGSLIESKLATPGLYLR